MFRLTLLALLLVGCAQNDPPCRRQVQEARFNLFGSVWLMGEPYCVEYWPTGERRCDDEK